MNAQLRTSRHCGSRPPVCRVSAAAFAGLMLLAAAAVVGCSPKPASKVSAANEPPASAATPAKKEEKPTPFLKLANAEHALGVVPPGSSHAVTIQLENRGGAELTVKKEDPGDPALVYPTEVSVPAGESRPLTITVVAPRRPGKFGVKVGFTTNDPDRPLLVWKATGVSVEGALAMTTPAPVEEAAPVQALGTSAAAAQGKPPVLKIDHVTLDAGDIRKGKTAYYTFKITNSGKGEGQLSAKPGCGCTMLEADKTIAPGQTGVIKAKLDTAAYSGKITKAITVTTNDPKRPQWALVIAANVIPHVRVIPADHQYVVLFEGERKSVEFSLCSAERGVLEIKSVQETGTKLKRELVPAKVTFVADGKPASEPGYKLRVTIPGTLPAGEFSSVYALETNNKEEPKVTLTISGKVQKEIVVTPSTFYFVVRDGGKEKLTRSLSVTKRTGTFEITKVDVRGQPLTASVSAIQKGSSYRVDLTYKGGWEPGFINAILSIHTNDKAQPVLEVPLSASVVAPIPKQGGGG
ncbi:MAG: hypothetical protein COZ06_05085 [Armatimonadetes bacterium CG_4_10_14_3_um_filter_66_18]|nr:DUF1573 domain-containing protein [Armatimonadota bacterium]PIX39332.1 MAG: hypothetical protein COZ57_28450 [Armatimonadetes bacterium CG_4_8_14_3_um_filter_66_20]PIY51255.1 MAG: hypothetical protein COZ06_05085 [Armatimonadetes bacterium CG_4_10_14_3_um_filter_66_18]PIZ44894.1 MAG: hypothetical protein COY42_13160 [Armatimonadetes bacterium CG_4_10_14_0_8_um_filter_66_14]NCP28948.1 DUF1573 domain-containing protein [Armatimonadota bacterium]